MEGKWPSIAEAYLPDGAREFSSYPVASLGWMMFIAMAVAKFWDVDWEKYDKIEDLYLYLRDKRGYDNLDEYILDEVLDLHGADAEQMQELGCRCVVFPVDHTEPDHVIADYAAAADRHDLVRSMPSRPMSPACRSCTGWVWPCN